MTIRTLATTGYVHSTHLLCEFGITPHPLAVYSTLEEFDAAYPPELREDEYDAPIRVVLTYDIDVRGPSQEDPDSFLAAHTVEDSEDGALAALIGEHI
jgi:hypothetical protein